jgi:hypothetical protein
LLRDFIRTHVFERFPTFFGLSIGASVVLLAAWALALLAGTGAVSLGSLAGWAVVSTLAGGVLIPSLTRLSRHHAWASAAEPRVFAIGFALVTIAAAVVASGAVLLVGALLLAALGLPPAAGIALLQAGTGGAAAAAALALGIGFATHGGVVEVTERQIEIAGLDPALAGIRIAHLSDLHIGNGNEGARLAALVERTNAVGADLVAITGDLFDNDAEILAHGAAALAGLRAPLGVWCVFGNHDGFVGADDVAAALAAHAPSIRVLRGEVARIDAAAPLWIAGFDDPGHDWKEGEPTRELDALAASLPADGSTVLLMHRPDPFPRAVALGFALVLSGHFHGGQVALPFAGGRWNAARLLTRYDRGLFRHDGASLYVSRGLGFAGPRLRFAAPPEIAVHALVPAAALRSA